MTRRVEVSRPNKVLWPALDVTKQAYADYLSSVGEHMVPWLRRRPLTLVRAPDGIEGQRYFQKDTPNHAPGWIRTVSIPAPSAKRDVRYTICDDAATLRWLGNQAALEFHPAPVRVDRLDRPDQLVVDIDPPEGAFDAAVEVAGARAGGTRRRRARRARQDHRRQRAPRGRPDRTADPPGGTPTGGGRDHVDRGCAPTRPRDRRIPQGETRRARDARPVPERGGRHRRGAPAPRVHGRRERCPSRSRPATSRRSPRRTSRSAPSPGLLDGPGPRAWARAVRRRPQRLPSRLLEEG